MPGPRKEACVYCYYFVEINPCQGYETGKCVYRPVGEQAIIKNPINDWCRCYKNKEVCLSQELDEVKDGAW